MRHELATFAVTAFATIFSIVDPFAAAPVFLAITPADTDVSRRRMARLASLVAGGVLLVFACLGHRIFEFFGITTSAFRAAGGLLLLVLAFDMMRARENPKTPSPEERQEGIEKADVAVTPLAIPLLAGPGAISTVTLMSTEARSWVHLAIVAGAIVLTSLLSWLILANSSRLVRLIGQIGLKVLTRVMGLLLAGMGAQFVLAGTREFLRGP
ncbi:MAG: NAAT family transporter [Planctomycetes bacterium]|nr:NAAT family transporter [Planctomycetota bacterium]